MKQKQCSQLDTPLMEMIIVSEEVLELSFVKARGEGYSINPWVGRSGAAPHSLTLFKTNIADFPTPV